MKNHELQQRILDIFDYSYANSPIRIPANTCREVGKLLHVGMYIEECTNNVPAFSFSGNEVNQLTGKRSSLSKKVAGEVRDHYSIMNKKWKMYDDDIKFTDQNIAYIASRLTDIYISDPKRDVFGDVLELFRSQWAKQEGGQFFTDSRVTHLAMSILDFDPTQGDDLIDLCAGTGGFLLAGFNQIKKISDQLSKDEKYVTHLAKESLFGQEIDESVAELGNSTLSARTGSALDKFISVGNSLDKSNSLRKYKKAATNPPFGAKISIQDDYLLSQYQLAKLSNSNCKSVSIRSTKLFKRAPDILFLERNIDILVEGEGQLAIVVPYQILSGPQTYFVRNWLLKNTKIIAVIDLPGETFQPHTGTKTCLLVVKRLKAPLLTLSEIEEYDIFMACPRWIGHDRRGNPVYKKNVEGMTTDEILTDFPQLEESFIKFKKTGILSGNYSHSYLVKSIDIIGDELLRMNAAFYNPMHGKASETIDKSHFEMVPLSKLTERVFYPGRFKRDYVDRYESAVPFLGGTNITQMIDHTDKWLRHDDPKLPHLTVKKGWILITRSGTTGIVSSVPARWDGYAVSEHVIRIVPKKGVSSSYLLAYLKTPQCQAALAKGIFGSVIDEITPETVENISVPIPRDEQLYKTISRKVEIAERARSKALDELYGAISDLTAVLSS